PATDSLRTSSLAAALRGNADSRASDGLRAGFALARLLATGTCPDFALGEPAFTFAAPAVFGRREPAAALSIARDFLATVAWAASGIASVTLNSSAGRAVPSRSLMSSHCSLSPDAGKRVRTSAQPPWSFSPSRRNFSLPAR